MGISIRDYEQAELSLAGEEGRRGLTIHMAVTALVSLALILVNVLAVPQFPWSPFPVAGMGVGVLVHYLFGVRWQAQALRAHQQAIEQRAARLHGV